MTRYTVLITCCSLIGALLLGVSEARSESTPADGRGSVPAIFHGFSPLEPFETPVDTFHLARYSFDDFTVCTPQGWMEVDRTSGYGDFSGLLPGITVLQEDPCFLEYSCVWEFFNNSTFDYACGGHPEQTAVPHKNDHDLFLSNEIWSPEILISGSGSNFMLGFHVYRDLPLENLVFYAWRVRSIVGGVPRDWRSIGTYYYGGDKDWMPSNIPVGALIEPDAEAVQIALGCHDLCGAWCGFLGDGSCHSHAPLFDNISFLRVDDLGPAWTVRHVDLFQDNFASDGTVTGTVRADAAVDIMSRSNPAILPGDSVCVTVSAFDAGLDHHFSGDADSGPAVYCHVRNVNLEKSGAAISGDPMRWPPVTMENDWTVLQMDTAYAADGKAAFNRFCVDLNDNLYTPGDTIYYFFAARDAGGRTSYWSRTEKGQGSGFTTTDIAKARSNSMEFTCLPAAVTTTDDILYVDDADDESPVPQMYFDTAFELLGLSDKVDRFDVLGSSSLAGNGPGSRIVDALEQVIPYYRTIIWSSGSLSSGLVGDGSGRPEKSPDAQFLYAFLDQHPFRAGVYISGDHIAEEWNQLNSGPIQDLKDFIDHTLLSGDHYTAGEPISPYVTGVSGSIFDDMITGVDTFVAYGGCPIIDRFDILQPAGNTTGQMTYSGNIGHGAVISASSLNSHGGDARVILSGFSYNKIRDAKTQAIPARLDHLRDILVWLREIIFCPVSDCSISGGTLTAGGSGIELNWDLGTCGAIAEELRIYRDPDLHLATIPLTQTCYIDDTVMPGESYEYWLGVWLPPSGGGQCPVIPQREKRISLGVVQAVPFANMLGRNYPNPFKPSTMIEYSIEKEAHVSIRIYNVRGRLVKILVNENQAAKFYRVNWDGTSDEGNPVASGVYLYRMVTAGFEQTKKMILLR